MKPRNRFQGMNSASLCSLAGRYDNPIPPRFLAPKDSLKIPALVYTPALFFVPAHQAYRLVESIPWNRFLSSLNVHKFSSLVCCLNISADIRKIVFFIAQTKPRNFCNTCTYISIDNRNYCLVYIHNMSWEMIGYMPGARNVYIYCCKLIWDEADQGTRINI